MFAEQRRRQTIQRRRIDRAETKLVFKLFTTGVASFMETSIFVGVGWGDAMPIRDLRYE